jgi:hypothetical protein
VYGTVATIRLKSEKQTKFLEIARAGDPSAGLAFDYVYRADSDPCAYILVVALSDKAAYDANAASPEQHTQYLRYRSLMETEPEWQDGEIILAYPS